MKDILARCLSLLVPPASVYTRGLLLLGGLVVVKLCLLIELKKEVFEAHFRMERIHYNWVSYFSFYLFIALGILALIRFGFSCRAGGPKAIRAANCVVLCIGLISIIATFGPGGTSLSYLVVTRTMPLTKVTSFLLVHLFMRPPFLAIWVLSYGVTLFILVRAGYESRSFYLTSFFGCAFALFFLRGTISLRNELLLADIVGIIVLLFSLSPTRLERPGWLIVPFAWAVAFFLLLYEEEPKLFSTNPYVLTLFVETGLLFTAATMVAKDFKFFDAWMRFFPFYLLGFFFMINTGYSDARNLGNLFSEAFELPRYFIGELILAIIFIESANLYSRLRPNWPLWPWDIGVLLIILVSFLDLRLTRITGIRLRWDVLSFANSPIMAWRMARPYLPAVIFTLSLVTLFYYFVLQRIELWTRQKSPATVPQFKNDGVLFVASIALAVAVLGSTITQKDKGNGEVLLNLLQSSPYWKQTSTPLLTREQLKTKIESLGLGSLSGSVPGTSRPHSAELNVVFILLESTYNQNLSLFSGSEDTEPRLSAYKDRMEVFPNCFSSFAASIQARFATFTSLYPIRDYDAFTLNPVNVKSLFEVLHENGYTNSIFYSSYFDYTGFRDFLKPRHLDHMYDADSMPGLRKAPAVSWGLQEVETVSAICHQLQEYSMNHEKFFLTYIPAAPHYPCDGTPVEFQKFGKNLAISPANYKTLYMNSMLYVDSMIAAIINQLEKSRLLDKTLVVITADHGEMLGVNGGPIGHGWKITPTLANVPLIVMNPRNPGYKINYTIGSQVDLLPTVLDCLGIKVSDDQQYEGQSLYAVEKQRDHLIYLNSYQDYAIIRGNHFYCCNREMNDGNHGSTLPDSVYNITNQGCNTVFIQEEVRAPERFSINSLEEFQRNLFVNYSAYCRLSSPAAKLTKTENGK